MRPQVDEELAVGELVGEEVRRARHERGLADPGHAVDGVDPRPARRGRPQKLSQLLVASREVEGVPAQSVDDGRPHRRRRLVDMRGPVDVAPRLVGLARTRRGGLLPHPRQLSTTSHGQVVSGVVRGRAVAGTWRGLPLPGTGHGSLGGV
ncbi:hypothetical protein [Streptomyces luteocolor]|uniref:hypothetical protein n=1 Tax=Streptomyces luteocolor TaxID=285500 RepID=UPI00114C9196|nr:hypothetical protein [Streptomyces luteocolor]